MSKSGTHYLTELELAHDKIAELETKVTFWQEEAATLRKRINATQKNIRKSELLTKEICELEYKIKSLREDSDYLGGIGCPLSEWDKRITTLQEELWSLE